MKNPPDGIQVGLHDENIYKWRIIMEGPEDTPWEGGVFPCTLLFPSEYPQKPPSLTMDTPGFWHPNVFPDGKVCISILHDPSDLRYNTHEDSSEKWRPVLGVEQILLSVQSMLNEPNTSSPANVDASVQFRDDFPAYKKKVRAIVRKSLDAL
jgi:ubiquitin-conjugating enzyme E2 G1